MPEVLMKALVSRDGRAQFEERPIPNAAPDEVVIRTTAVSLCAADPAGVDGAFDSVGARTDGAEAHRGVVLGHEGVGVVHAVGADVTGFRLGERVMTTSTASCGRCENCQRGLSGHCRGVLWGGYSYGAARDGCLAQYYSVQAAEFNLARIPDGVSDLGALFVADSFATGSAAIEGAELPFGGTVAVIGQGHIGLGATAAARIAGASLVVTVKTRPGDEELSRSMGADVALNLATHDIRDEIDRLTGGRGVDLAVEASGALAGFELAIELTRLGGQVSGVATYTTTDVPRLTIPLANWGWGVGDKSIRTSYQPAGSERAERLMRLVERHRVDPAPMFTHEYGFDDALRALEDMRRGAPGLMKPFIRF